ncbi:MAG: ferredoxin [Solirubrobacterales bacterium]|nr:ferredoxin [Solirubrobacterales bacterium]
MRVTVDLSRCQGYANCVTTAPDIFDLDDDSGQAVVLTPEVGPEQLDAARQAVDMCPAQAISLVDASGADSVEQSS